MDPFGTHAPFLRASLNFLDEMIDKNQELVMFEVGTGGLSSEIFQEALCKIPNSRLVSFENDSRWSEIYRSNYAYRNSWQLLEVAENSLWERILKREIEKLRSSDLVLSFIDSSPWESRAKAVQLLRQSSTLVVIHDVDYFPRSGVFGKEINPIQNSPKNFFRYGELRPEALGERNYDDIFEFWSEIFPEAPGYFTGPPTLIGSNTLDVRRISLPKNAIVVSQSR